VTVTQDTTDAQHIDSDVLQDVEDRKDSIHDAFQIDAQPTPLANDNDTDSENVVVMGKGSRSKRKRKRGHSTASAGDAMPSQTGGGDPGGGTSGGSKEGKNTRGAGAGSLTPPIVIPGRNPRYEPAVDIPLAGGLVLAGALYGLLVAGYEVAKAAGESIGGPIKVLWKKLTGLVPGGKKK
jgi:hypothetical protein